MKCKRASELISDYLDGRLAEPARQEFESHLADCSYCASEVEAASELLASLSSLSGRRSPVDCWSGVRAAISAHQRAATPWWHWVVRPVVAAPAAAVAVALAVFLMWPSGNVPMASDKASEYSYYIGAHSHLQRQQTFADPDVVFVGAELQKASLVASTEE